jgi:Na+-driven multidrug efflux pump
MEKVGNLSKKLGFSVLVFFICLFLFSWPILSITNKGHPEIIFLYLFLVWLIIIILIFIMSRSYRNLSSNEGRTDKGAP